ncbi:S9 family peptidase [Taibaiella sp. KBW10]|uniref:S9 family peptidase n=1 Tax=Taibaiella sp. KBW10 TaxID=2153357 RepID=UPI000F5980FA|nr:S9 family peptidase [Taibaiella sp. KBW10]RQO31870.1 S9 family peptidase [Taibaiella sp. KBW10]
MRHTFLTITLLFTMVANTFAQISGSWKGSVTTQGTTMNMIVHITEEKGKLTASLDIPDQGATGLPFDKVEFSDPTLNLSMSQAGLSYSGTLKGNTITGTFKQGGGALPLNLEKTTITKPGDVSLPSSQQEINKLIAADKGTFKYKAEDYFATPKSSQFQLSPDGKYLSYMEKEEDGKRHVYVKDVATGKVTRAIEEKKELIKGYGWVNDQRLIYLMDNGGNENYHVFAANIDGSNTIDLTPYEGVKASIMNMLKEQKDYIIVSMNKENKQIFEPYRVNVVTGAAEKLYSNTDVANPISDYIFDKDGNLRGYSKMVNGTETHTYFKVSGAKDFELATKSKWDESFAIESFNYASLNPDDAYVLTSLDADKARIVLYDFKTKKILKEVFSNKDYDASIISLSRKRNYEIDFLGYEGEKEEIVPVSQTFKKIYASLSKQFKGYEFSIAGKTDQEDKYLIVVQSDKLYGRYYIYDSKSGKATLLYDLMPQLKEADMAVMKPITFKSRDGLTIHGYITLPKAALEGKKVPLIVNPHGGPQGVRDSWGFNPETQLFASRGYATLQVNFRISGGYGKEFLRAGFKQIGRKAMDDVEDGVKYAISQGWVDKDNIAIYGGSHGGYATLMGLVKTPELYKCGIDYVGVSNIETFFASFPEYWKPYTEMVKEIWYDLDKPEEAKIAKEVSPFYQLNKINKPLFVVQGANDPRVNINESDQIVKALRAKGFEVPYLVKYNEGHGFQRDENSIEFYKAMLGFLAENLKQ